MQPNFFTQVYLVVKRIPRGRVASYGQIAALLGYPRAARTVGWALSSLSADQATRVPWQRVINSAGRISISRLDISPQMQRRLLEEEGVVFGADEHVDWQRFGWAGLSPWEIAELLEQGGEV